MSVVIGTASTTSSTSLTLDLNALTSRIAKLLRRNDLDTEILQWINFAQRELTDKVNFPELRRGVYQTLSTVQAEPFRYTLPDDFSRMDRVYWEDTTSTPSYGRTLTPLPRYLHESYLQHLLDIDNPISGDPLYYFIDNSSILLYPSPSKAARLELYYYRVVTDMTLGTNTPDINVQWRHYLIYLAYYLAFIRH